MEYENVKLGYGAFVYVENGALYILFKQKLIVHIL